MGQLFVLAAIAAFSMGMIAVPAAPDDCTFLKGAAKRAFEKSKGESQAGKKIAIEITGGGFDPAAQSPWKKSDRFATFREAGVDYVFDRTSPYIEQTMRKCSEKKTPMVLVKGVVTSVGTEKEPAYAVMIDTAQVIEKAPRKAPAKKKTASTENRD